MKLQRSQWQIVINIVENFIVGKKNGKSVIEERVEYSNDTGNREVSIENINFKE